MLGSSNTFPIVTPTMEAGSPLSTATPPHHPQALPLGLQPHRWEGTRVAAAAETPASSIVQQCNRTLQDRNPCTTRKEPASKHPTDCPGDFNCIKRNQCKATMSNKAHNKGSVECMCCRSVAQLLYKYQTNCCRNKQTSSTQQQQCKKQQHAQHATARLPLTGNESQSLHSRSSCNMLHSSFCTQRLLVVSIACLVVLALCNPDGRHALYACMSTESSNLPSQQQGRGVGRHRPCTAAVMPGPTTGRLLSTGSMYSPDSWHS